MKCHDVVHISLLRPYDKSDPDVFPGRLVPDPPPPLKVEGGVHYFNIERIVSHYPHNAASHATATHFLVKWEGYPMWENTKEPAANIMNDTPDTVQEYLAAKGVAAAPRMRAPTSVFSH